jgi:pimeloyl-ACP methyl ester carboxylesterase
MRNAGHASDTDSAVFMRPEMTICGPLGDLSQDAPDLIIGLEASARIRATPCGGGHVAWRIWGEGAPIVLFHGAFGSWTHWLKSIAVLARNHQVFVPDMPGFGDSAMPPEPHNADAPAGILSDGLRELVPSSEAITFVGFSFGGQMAARCARNLRDRARQIILVSSSNLGIPRGKPDAMVGWRHLQTRAERDAAHRRNLEVMMIHDPSKIDNDAIWIQRNNAERARLRDLPLSPLRQALEEAGRPIAFVCGDEDPRCGPVLEPIAHVLKDIDPWARFIVLRGQGHWLAYEAPDKLNAVLLALLDGDPAGLFAGGSRVDL